MISFKWLNGLALAAAVVLAGGCGSGSGGSPITPIPQPVQKDLALTLSFDSPQVVSDGHSTVKISVDVRDKSNNSAVAKEAVSFAVDSGRLSAGTVSTDDGGTASTVFDSNNDKSNRTVTVTATAGGTKVSATIAVVGTTIVFGGNPSTVIGDATDVVLSVLDGAGAKVPNAAVTLTSTGGTLDKTSVTTDASGNATVKFTATTSGTATISATGMGATNSRQIAVSGVNFKFEPMASSTVTIDTCTVLKVDLLGASGPISFATTRGTMYTDAACTVGGGTALTGVPLVGSTATVYTKSDKAGTVTVQAIISGASTTISFNYVSVTPSSIQISASPTTVAVGGNTEARAIVRDAKGNPVEGQQVFFSSTGATPLPQIALTNSSGVAVSKFTADSVPSGQGEIQLKAEMPTFGLSATSALTISGSPVQVSIGTNDVVTIVDAPPIYQYAMSVTVKDSNGSPVPGQVVTISLAVSDYGKGYYVAGSSLWSKVTTASCPSEDPNGNGVVDPGEPGDVNGNGILDPQNGTTIRAANSTATGNTFNVTMGADGRATIWLEYPKNEASWLKVDIVASAAVSGQNAVAHSTFYTPVPASVLQAVNVQPAFYVSPYGTAPSCTDPK